MKHSAIVVAAFLMSVAPGAEALRSYGETLINGKYYNIEQNWLNADEFTFTKIVDPVPEETWVNSICVVGDYIFVCGQNYKEDNKFAPLRFDAETGERLDPVEIDWNGVEHTATGCAFSGMDSEGTPFFASRSDGSNAAFPFRIYPFEVVDGHPKVLGFYDLWIDKTWHPRMPMVTGSLLGGNFRVGAAVWTGNTPEMQKVAAPGVIALWRFKNGNYDGGNMAQAKVSDCIVQPLSDDRVLIYDRNCYEGITGYDYTTPHICHFDSQSNLVTDSALDAGDAGYGFGTSTVGGLPIAFWGRDYVNFEYLVSAMPDYPRSFIGYEDIWKRDDRYTEHPYLTGTLVSGMKGSQVFPVADDPEQTSFYVFSHNRGIAKYTVTAHSHQVGIDAPTAAAAESQWYTLAGAAIPTPTAPGLYLRRTSLKTELVYIASER